MQKIFIVLLLVALGFIWKPSIETFYAKMLHKITNEQANNSNPEEPDEQVYNSKPDEQADNSNSDEPDDPSNTGNYKCDGRIYCSQMTSCEEATFFLENRPGVKMDGDHDGVPCESQWCG